MCDFLVVINTNLCLSCTVSKLLAPFKDDIRQLADLKHHKNGITLQHVAKLSRSSVLPIRGVWEHNQYSHSIQFPLVNSLPIPQWELEWELYYYFYSLSYLNSDTSSHSFPNQCRSSCRSCFRPSLTVPVSTVV